MCHSFFGKHLNASPLPLFEAAPGFPSVGRRADRRTDDSPPAEKNHHVKKKYIKRDTQSKFVRVRTYSCHHHHRVRVFNGSAESEWTERERSRTVSPTVRAHRPSDRLHCLPVNRWGWLKMHQVELWVEVFLFSCEEASYFSCELANKLQKVTINQCCFCVQANVYG